MSERSKKRVLVVGGGISGLAAAHALHTKHAAAADVTLLEASGRLGGNVRTTRRDGYVIDEGPDSWVAAKPYAATLARELGLGDRIIETIPENRRVYVLQRRMAGVELVPLPEGLMLGVPTKIWPLVKTPLISWPGKIRAALDLIAPKGFGRREIGDGDDESVGAFVQRRVGREVLAQLAGPLLGGLFSGDVSELSLMATFPQLAAFEQRGGLIRGARALTPKRPPGQPPGSPFHSLVSGIGEMVEALAARLGDVPRLGVRATRVSRLPEGDERGRFAVELDGHPTEFADAVVLAGPAHVAAGLIRDLDASSADTLDAIPYASSAVVFLAFQKEDVPRALDATGYLVPADAKRAAAATTWVSSKWPWRAPEDHVLIRTFFPSRHVDLDDANLVAFAREEARASLGVTVPPVLTHVARFRRASPQPRVGHPARIKALKARLPSGLFVIGGAIDGVGMSDCIRQGEEAAARAVG